MKCFEVTCFVESLGKKKSSHELNKDNLHVWHETEELKIQMMEFALQSKLSKATTAGIQESGRN